MRLQKGETEMQSKLKPCPFCGGKAEMKVCDAAGSHYAEIGQEMYRGRKMTHFLIRCESCGVKTKAYLTIRRLFNAWNRRADNENNKTT